MEKLPGMSYRADTVDSELRRRIQERAYALWEADGRSDRRALAYWLQAEKEIVTQSIAGEEDPARRNRPRGVVRMTGRDDHCRPTGADLAAAPLRLGDIGHRAVRAIVEQLLSAPSAGHHLNQPTVRLRILPALSR
jgi:hypothetical protein